MLIITQIDGLVAESISYFNKIYFDRYNAFNYVSGDDRICQPIDDNLLFYTFDADTKQNLKFRGKELLNILFYDGFTKNSYFQYVIPDKYRSFSELFQDYDEYAEFLKYFVRQGKPDVAVANGIVYFPFFFGRQARVYLSCSDDKFKGAFAKFLLFSEPVKCLE